MCGENLYLEVDRCVRCPAESTSPKSSVAPTDCKCNEGFYPTDENHAACSRPDWITADKCDDSQFLNNTSLEKFDWKCESCPVGGSCRGETTLKSMHAMFGWSQCPRSTNQNSSVKKFARCMFAPACLGGTNTALLEKFKINGTNDPAQCSDENCTAECNLQAGYAHGSRLCGQCASNFSHDGLTGKCNACPPPGQNIVVGIVGVVAGLLGLVVFIQITLSDGGTLDESDGAKSIGLSFIQLISLLVTFPIAWPPIFIAIFQVGGAITVLGQHLVNLKW